MAATAPGGAQTPPPAAPAQSAPPPQPFTGFVSPYEIVHTLRSAGFDPLAPPLREGTTYVVRATDFRGILMRVVVDARTGAIRDANRIVPAPGRFGEFYGAPPPYDPSGYDAATGMPDDEMGPTLPPQPGLDRPGGPHSPLTAPPLPRPRPAALELRKPGIGQAIKGEPPPDPKDASGVGPDAETATKPGGKSPAQPDNSEVTTAAPPAAPAASKTHPAVVPPLND